MSTKRFCNGCEKEIRKSELYFRISVNAVREEEGIGPANVFTDFCISCVGNGNCIKGVKEVAERITSFIEGKPLKVLDNAGDFGQTK